MLGLHRPTLRDVVRVVAVCIVATFVLSAMSIAYAAGRHAGHPAEQGTGTGLSRL